MKNRIIHLALAFCFIGTIAAAGLAQSKASLRDQARQSDRAGQVFSQIMRTPDKAIPNAVLDRAACVAVFPRVLKAGFIVGGRGGRGVASCRVEEGWSAPIFLDLKGGSFGWQIGAQSTDFVMLFMNRSGIDSLLSSKFTVGGDASVAAGPVGRQTGASTDIKLDAQILSYSRSRGLFAGLELKGVVISPESKRIEEAYGENITPKEILEKGKVKAPALLQAFPAVLRRYSPRPAAG
jgi:lipid-binding SYLF domain-containing protein